MSNDIENPYLEKLPEETIEFRAPAAWVFVGIFLALITVPPFVRNWHDATRPLVEGEKRWVPVVNFYVHPNADSENALKNMKERNPEITRTKPNVSDHLRAFESRLEDEAIFVKAGRRMTQGLLTRVFREGNRKTVIGGDGWMFYRPAIDSLTGYGPLKEEPKSVADDPTLPPWQGPLQPILRYGEQLKEFGVELILVPIPVKPMLVGQPEVVRHADAERFYGILEENGIEVLDIAGAWRTSAPVDELFLKQDTHWTPEGMGHAAEIVADFVKSRKWFAELESDPARFSRKAGHAEHTGDLVGNLDLGDGQTLFAEEKMTVQRVVDTAAGEVVKTNDEDSPIVLLGDSFTNIFSKEDMHWGTGAGFGQHLAALLGMPLDVIAINGEASTGVRRQLARRRGAATIMRERKKAVIWTMAARDLFLAESVAQETDVGWGEVTFDTREPALAIPAGAMTLVVEGTMTLKSPYPNPKDVTYPNSLYGAEYQVDKVVKGEYGEEIAVVYHWAFQNRKTHPQAGLREGGRFRMTLVPLEVFPALKSERVADDTDFLADVIYFATEIEEIK